MGAIVKTDFLVVGAGLAGSLVALELVRAGCSVAMMANSAQPSSSRVAGGLVNPVTGKYLAKTWMADTLFEHLAAYYAEWEKVFSASFYHKIGLYRPFTGEEHKRSALAQLEKHDLNSYLCVSSSPAHMHSYFRRDAGEGLFAPLAGWLDVPVFLNAAECWLRRKVQWIDAQLDLSKLEVLHDRVRLPNGEARRVIFCEGVYAQSNPFFHWLPFNPVKGETLLGRVDGYRIPTIINQGKWLIPLGGDLVRLGATYSWHELDFEPTESGKEALLQAAEEMLTVPFRIIGHQAGVRPATRDRRPIVGSHPVHSHISILNGLGTKGVSLGPWCAHQLVRNLLYDEVIHPEANIERFYPLYS